MKAELLNYFGSDDMVVDAARVSYGKEASNYTRETNEKLIRYLAEHKHTAPFRHPQLQFRVECPIYVERQLFKHQIGISANSISGRYVDFSDSYYKIEEGKWRKQSTSSKQGSDGIVKGQRKAEIIQNSVIEICQKAYNELLELGVAKEQARSILPLNLNTQFIWTGSLLAFIHLCKLRLKLDAQEETRLLVAEMKEKVIESKAFPISMKVFDLTD